MRQTGTYARDHLLVATSVQIAHTEYYTILVCRADQPADNRADCRSAKGNPSGIVAVMVGVMNDMIPRRRRRRTMRTMPPAIMRRGNRRRDECAHFRIGHIRALPANNLRQPRAQHEIPTASDSSQRTI